MTALCVAAIPRFLHTWLSELMLSGRRRPRWNKQASVWIAAIIVGGFAGWLVEKVARSKHGANSPISSWVYRRMWANAHTLAL